MARRGRRKSKGGRKHQCYYKIGGRYLTPKQASRKRSKRKGRKRKGRRR